MRSTHDILVETRAALPALTASRERKNTALAAIADRLLAEQDSILAANQLDIEASRDKYGSVMIDRLTLTPERIAGMAQGVREVAALPDPEGQVLWRRCDSFPVAVRFFLFFVVRGRQPDGGRGSRRGHR